VIRALLIVIAFPGSGLLLLALLRAVTRSKEAREDTERRDRIAAEYSVPDWAVEVPEPTGKRAVPRSRPDIPSRYTETV